MGLRTIPKSNLRYYGPEVHVPKFEDLTKGLVISYSYLWHREYEQARIEGIKDRPAAVILAANSTRGVPRERVLVAPITHSPLSDPSSGLEIPNYAKRVLNLDDHPSFVVTTEVNDFTWPGYDLRPVHGSRDKCVYGSLPGEFVDRMVASIMENARSERLLRVPRV